MKRGSTRRLARRSFLKGALATAPLLLVGPSLLRPAPARAVSTGPSTTTDPYLVPSLEGVRAVSILTVGDAIDGYRMVGIPDGLGAFEGRRDLFTVLMNHELGGSSGIPRAHGSKGAFVSRWTIDRKTLEVVKGEDFTQSAQDVFLWDPATRQYVPGTTTWERYCSADLASESAFEDDGRGTEERIYLNGEEVSGGRAWARIATGPHAGEAWQLPRLGRMAYENAVASPYAQDKTVVMLTDDGNLSTARGRKLPERGLRLRRHQDAARAPDRAGRPDQRQVLRPESLRAGSAGGRGEQRIRPGQRRHRVRRALGDSAFTTSTTSPISPRRRSRRPPSPPASPASSGPRMEPGIRGTNTATTSTS